MVLVLPIEEDTFYDVNGYEVSRSGLVQAMIDYYQLKLKIGETRVTDFNEGSEVRNLLEAIAVDVYNLMLNENELTKIAFVETAEGEWLDKHGANPFVQLARDTGSESTGFVTFTIPAVMTEDVTIPLGTVVVSVDSGLQYVTDSDLIIPVGETSISGSVTCLTVGLDGNCQANTITLIEDETLGVNGLTVNNSEALTGGVDYEEDDDYRERLLAFLRKDDFGSLGYYTNLGNNVSGVHDVDLVTSASYTRKVLVNGDVKPTPDSVLANVLEVFSIPDNLVLGHTFEVAKPTYVSHDLTVNLTVSDDVVSDDEFEEFLTAIFDGGSALVGFTFDGLSIGESLSKDSLYNSFSLIEYVEDIEITENSTEISDLTVTSGQVLKLGTVTINQTVSS